MAFFPAAVATTANLYTAVNSLQTTLATGLGTGDTSVVLASATGFPTAGAVTIDNEVIFYTGVSGATLTGCTRGSDGTTAATHSVGVPVGASIIAFHHNGLMTEIIAVETFLNTKFGTSGSAYTVSRALQTNSSTGIPEVSSVTNTELGYLSGVTSAIQTQMNLKAPLASPTFTGTITTPLTSARAMITGAANELGVSGTTSTEISYLSGVTSAIQTQLDARLSKTGGTMSGAIAMGTSKITGIGDATAVQDTPSYKQVKILQVLQANVTAEVSSTSVTYADTGLTISITPSNVNSKILVFCSIQTRCRVLSGGSTNSVMGMKLLRDSTVVLYNGAQHQLSVDTTGNYNAQGYTNLVALDSPASTAALTYKVQMNRLNGTGTVYTNDGSVGPSTITVMEVNGL